MRPSPRISRRRTLAGAAALAGLATTSTATRAYAAAGSTTGASSSTMLSRSDRVFLRRGLRHGAWVETEPGWAPSPGDFRASGFSDPTFYDPPLWRAGLMDGLPGYPWSATKGPSGQHLRGASDRIPDPILTPAQRARVDDLFSFCFGDEEQYSPDLLVELSGLFAKMRAEAPEALLHTNQYSGEWSEDQLREYLAVCQPDLITYDNYYFSTGGHPSSSYLGGSVTPLYDGLAFIRRLALGGHDGNGDEPIQFGQYTMGFESPGDRYIISGSQQYVVSYVTWAMGGRWLDLFRWQHGDTALLTRADGSPTLQMRRYQELNRQANVLSPYLTRLRSSTVGIVLGQNLTGPNPQPSVPLFGSHIDPATRITKIEVMNIGGANDGLPGDVLVGTFRPIPGMTSTEAGVFQDPRTPAFMVTNTLTAANPEPTNESGAGGNGRDTRQRITITFELDEQVTPGRLRTLDIATAKVRVAHLSRTSTKHWQATFESDGGTGRLFWWDLK